MFPQQIVTVCCFLGLIPTGNVSETFTTNFFFSFCLLVYEILLQDFLVILKKCFLGTTWMVTLSAGHKVQPHTGVLPVVKGLKNHFYANHDVENKKCVLEQKEQVLCRQKISIIVYLW